LNEKEQSIWVSNNKRILAVKHGEYLECDFQVLSAKTGDWMTRISMSLTKEPIKRLVDLQEGAQ